jgi:hypothetical protein
MLKSLLKHQKIRIDAHQRGAGERVNWDETSNDIHIDKSTLYDVKGKKITVRIRIPINSNRPIQIDIVGNVPKPKQMLSTVERKLIQEIAEALSDPEVRRQFIAEVLRYLENYPSALTSLSRATNMANRIARHFNLSANISAEMAMDAQRIIRSFTAYFQDGNDIYFVQVTANGLVLGQEPDVQRIRSQRGELRILNI